MEEKETIWYFVFDDIWISKFLYQKSVAHH